MARYKDYCYEQDKMKTSHGVIQGYDGVAAVDDRHQIVVHAEAFGQAQEHDLLQPVVEATRDHFQALGDEDIWNGTRLTADSGFHTEKNMEFLYEHRVDGYVADNRMRQRDSWFQDTDKYKELTAMEAILHGSQHQEDLSIRCGIRIVGWKEPKHPTRVSQ